MQFDLVIKDGVVYTEEGFHRLNVGVRGEKIAVLALPDVELEGADALYTTNTPLGMKIDWRTRRPVLGSGQGPICGPAVRPVGVLRTWELYKRVRLPIIASGGICTWEDALEYILAGATAVGVGSAQFVYPDAVSAILQGLERYVLDQHLTSILDLVGAAQKVPNN